MLLSCYTKFNITEFAQIVKWTLVFVARWSIFSGLDSADMESLLFEMARSVRGVSDNDRSGPTAADIKESLRKASPTREQIQAGAAKLILPNDSAEYVIRKISDAMTTHTKEIVTGVESNLEHIYPQSPEEDQWGGEANQALLEPYTWHIGNLTMLGERLNTKAKNGEFSEKRPKYASSELLMARDVANSYTVWDRASIEKRAQSLAPFLNSIWDFDNPSKV